MNVHIGISETNSSNVESMEYWATSQPSDSEDLSSLTGYLLVTFTNGSRYAYYSVPASAIVLIMGMKSVGEGFNNFIKYSFKYNKLD